MDWLIEWLMDGLIDWMIDGWIDWMIDGWMDEWMNEQMDERTIEQVDEWMNIWGSLSSRKSISRLKGTFWIFQIDLSEFT